MTNKYLYILSFLVLSIVPVFAQEMISNYEGENTNSKNQVRSIEGRNYLVSFLQNDVVKVLEVHSIDSTTFLHQQSFSGIFSDRDVELNGQHLLFIHDKAIVIYDFVKIVSELLK